MNIRYPIYEGVYRILTIEVVVIIGLYGLETVYGHSAFRIKG